METAGAQHLFDAESVRYNELKRSVVGITNIMLTQCLRNWNPPPGCRTISVKSHGWSIH